MDGEGDGNRLIRRAPEPGVDDDEDLLTLSLGLPVRKKSRALSPPPPSQPSTPIDFNSPPRSPPLPLPQPFRPSPLTLLNLPPPIPPLIATSLHPQALRRRNAKTNPIEPPYPWATDRRVTLHTMEYLLSKGLHSITGDVHCKECGSYHQVAFDLHTKFSQIYHFTVQNMDSMNNCAPSVWLNPELPHCHKCGEHNCVQPVMPARKRSINWLFLFLGQIIGTLTLKELKYFCKHTNNHRTASKDRLLYNIYISLFMQLIPTGQIDII